MASAAPRTVEEGLVGTSVQMEEAARQRLAADFTPVVRMLNRQGYPTRMSIRFGDPVVEISKEAKVRDADLTILATRDRSGLSRLLSSSVPEGVLHSSDIPVLLAHAK